MARYLIEDYRLWWDFDDGSGYVAVKVPGRGRYKKITLKSVGEFSAITALLNGSKAVFVDPSKGGFGTVDDD